MIPYLWVKAVHVAAVLLFVGGLMAQAFGVTAGQRGDAGAIALISRWDRAVTLPAMLVVWLSGALIAAEGNWLGSPWLWAKLGFVVGLTGLHGVQSGKLRRLLRGDRVEGGLRGFSAMAFIAGSAVCVALLVVAKPF